MYLSLSIVQLAEFSHVKEDHWLTNQGEVWLLVACIYGATATIIWCQWNKLLRWHTCVENLNTFGPLLIISHNSLNHVISWHSDTPLAQDDVFRLAVALLITPHILTVIDVPRWVLVVSLLSMAIPLYLSPHVDAALCMYVSGALATELVLSYAIIHRERTSFVSQLTIHRAQDQVVQREKRIVQLQAQRKLDDVERMHEAARSEQSSQAADTQLRIISAATHDLKDAMDGLMAGCRVFQEYTGELRPEVCSNHFISIRILC